MDEIGILKKKCRTRALAQRKIFKTKSNDYLIQKNLGSALGELIILSLVVICL